MLDAHSSLLFCMAYGLLVASLSQAASSGVIFVLAHQCPELVPARTVRKILEHALDVHTASAHTVGGNALLAAFYATSALGYKGVCQQLDAEVAINLGLKALQCYGRLSLH
jgi:hypothetical protein